MGQTYHKLFRAKLKKDNEFYSTEAFVEEFMAKIFADPKCADIFRGKVVCCPCDTENSEFVRYFRRKFDKLGLKDLWFFADYYNSKVLDADYIITNPPFHKVNHWLEWLTDNGKKWAVVKNALSCYYKMHSGVIQDVPETSYYDAGSWNFIRPDGSERGIHCLFSSNFADYTFSRAPKTLFYSDYKHPTYETKTIMDAPVYFIEKAKKNGIPKDSKYIALSALFEVNKIVGWRKVRTTCCNFGTVNGRVPFCRVVWKKEE